MRKFYTDTFDAATELSDGLTAASATGVGQVGGVARVVNVGTGLIEAVLNVAVDAMDTGTGDETYSFDLEAANTPDFSSGVVVLDTVTMEATGHEQKPITNMKGGNRYPYLRIKANLAGTTPSTTFRAYITKSI